MPILSRGTLRAVLLLENRLLGGAFTTGRLDAVKLIASQLAVSLDNAQLYAESRQIAGEQAALRRVATLVAQAAPPEDVLPAVAAEAGRLLGVDAAVGLRDDAGSPLTGVNTRTEFARGQGPAAGTGHGELEFCALTVAWLGPGTAASWLMSAANSPKDRLCSASDSAFSGAGWTSISRP